MKFIYLTSKNYPSKTADHIFVKEMALAFAKILGNKFSLVLTRDSSRLFSGLNVVKTGVRGERWRMLYYFLWLPFFVLRQGRNSPDSVFFSNDPNLLADLIALRKVFRFKYKVCSEWHIMFEDWRDGFVARGSDLLVATSHKLKDDIVKKTSVSADPKKFLVVYGGVDLSRYKFDDVSDLRNELRLPKDKVLLAYVGLFKTLGTTKGIDTMIAALPFLPRNINMVFVGGRREEIEEYKKQISNPQLLERSIFVERQEGDRVPLYQMAVDMLVIPSPNIPLFNNIIPMKIYEYLASRKPILYSDLKILREVLGDCGFGFNPDDPKDLADKISAITKDDGGSVKKKVELCYARAVESSWDKRADNIVKFLG